MSEAALAEALAAIGADAETYEHPPVRTVEEARRHTAHLPGGHCKNLFLKDKKGGLWLVSCLDARRVAPGEMARGLGAPRFSFAKPELLLEVLGVTPGAVTPFALINDARRRVRPVFDAAFRELERVHFHPLRNDRTTAIAGADLDRFARSLGYAPVYWDFEAGGLAND